jgi:MscS family membrane protein
MLDTVYYGNTLLEWIVALAGIVAAYLVGRTAYWITSRWLKRLAERTDNMLDNALVDLLEEPFVLVVTLIGIRISLNTLNLNEGFAAGMNNFFDLLIVLFVAWAVTRLYDAFHNRFATELATRTETEFDDQILPAVRTGVRFVIWTTAIVVGLSNAGYDVAAILAGLGLGGLAFALAAQDTIANFFGGLIVFTQRPFQMGDRVQFDGIEARISATGLRTTTMTDLVDGHTIIVPNRLFTQGVLRNIDTRPSYTITGVLRLDPRTPSEKVNLAINLVEEITANHKDIGGSLCRFEKINDYSLDLAFSYSVNKFHEEIDGDVYKSEFVKQVRVKSFINLEIMRQFEENEIKLALPLSQNLALLAGD